MTTRAAMFRLLVTAPFILGVTPAAATGGLSCASPDERARIDLGIGHVPVLAIVSAWIEAGDHAWSTYATGHVTPVTVGQAFREEGRMSVDFTDPNVEKITVRLRTWSAREADEYVEIGWLQAPGLGVWPIVCREGE